MVAKRHTALAAVVAVLAALLPLVWTAATAPPAAADPSGSIHGTVTAADTGLPVGDVGVALWDVDGQDPVGAASGCQQHCIFTRSAADGTYTLAGVPVGSYLVRFTPDRQVDEERYALGDIRTERPTRYEPAWNGGTVDPSSAAQVVVTAGQTAEADTVLQVGGTLHAHLVNIDGSPSRACMDVYDSTNPNGPPPYGLPNPGFADISIPNVEQGPYGAGHYVTYGGCPDSNGDITIQGLPSGAYDLLFTTSGSIPFTYYPGTGGVDVNQATAVAVAAPAATSITESNLVNATVDVADADAIVPANQTTSLTIPAHSELGKQLTFNSFPSPNGQSTVPVPTSPAVSYTPTPGYTGTDFFQWCASDPIYGFFCGIINVTIGTGATPSETVETAPAVPVGTGAPTPSAPVQAQVSSPSGGTLAVTQTTAAAPSGYVLLGSQYQISAPQASVAAPLKLDFLVDSSALPAGDTPSSVTVFRDGVAIADCADSSGTATPDPCVSSRTVNGSVIDISVLSSHASLWTVAASTAAASSTTVTASPSTSVTYGQSVSFKATVAGTANVGGQVQFKVDGQNLGTPVALAGGVAMSTATTGLSATDHTVEADYLGDSASQPSHGTLTEHVAPATLTVTAGNASKVYGTANPAFSGTISGLVNGDPASTITGAPAYSTPATTLSPAGTYPINVDVSGLHAPNYVFVAKAGTLTVTRAPTALAVAPANIILQRNPLGIIVRIAVVSARLTTPNPAISTAGLPVTFSANGTALCTATTDTAGNAKCTITNLASVLLLELTGRVNGTFAGSQNYLSSSGQNGLIG